MAPEERSPSDAWQALKLFPVWLKEHFVAAVLTTAAALGAIQSIITIFKLPQSFVLPVAAGLFFLGTTLFFLWLISNPKMSARGSSQNSGQPSGETGPEAIPTPMFSSRALRMAKVVLPANIVLGTFVVFLVFPREQHPVSAIRKLLDNVESARNEMQNNKQAATLYTLYRDARAAQGEGFWDHVTWAMTVHVSEVAAHNQQLQTPIRIQIVPDGLTTKTDLSMSPVTFNWVKDARVASDLTFLVSHYLQADQVRIRIDSLKRGNVSDYEYAKQLNQEICRYWELVSGQQRTILTDAEPERIRQSEAEVRSWLRTQE